MPVAILEHIGRYVCCLKRGIYNSLHPPQGRASDWTAYTTAVIITAVNANQHPLPSPPLPGTAGRQGGGDGDPVNLYCWRSTAAGTSVGSSLFRATRSGIVSPDTFADKKAWGYLTNMMPVSIIDELMKQIND